MIRIPHSVIIFLYNYHFSLFHPNHLNELFYKSASKRLRKLGYDKRADKIDNHIIINILNTILKESEELDDKSFEYLQNLYYSMKSDKDVITYSIDNLIARVAEKIRSKAEFDFTIDNIKDAFPAFNIYGIYGYINGELISEGETQINIERYSPSSYIPTKLKLNDVRDIFILIEK